MEDSCCPSQSRCLYQRCSLKNPRSAQIRSMFTKNQVDHVEFSASRDQLSMRPDVGVAELAACTGNHGGAEEYSTNSLSSASLGSC